MLSSEFGNIVCLAQDEGNIMYVALFLLWIIFNGRFTVEVAIIGLIVAAVVFLFICKFMDYSIRKEKIFYILLPWMIKYFVILLIEIVKANIGTARFILNQKIEVEPKIVTFTPPITSGFLRVVLANSITLTPGTVTINVEDGKYTIHALDMELADDIGDSVFVREILKAQERMDRVK